MSNRKLLKAYPQLAKLNETSLLVANMLYQIRPDLLQFASVFNYENTHTLEIRIPSSSGESRKDILLTTEDVGITVQYFDWFHIHFSDVAIFDDQELDLTLNKALDFIDRYQKEEIVVAYNLHDTGLVSDGQSFDIKYINQINKKDFRYRASWRGTYDKDLLEDTESE